MEPFIVKKKEKQRKIWMFWGHLEKKHVQFAVSTAVVNKKCRILAKQAEGTDTNKIVRHSDQ